MMRLQLIAIWTITRKESWRIIRIWPQTLLPSVITMGLYFFIFGQLLGSRLGKIQHIPYIMYIAPGLIMMSVITNAYTNVSSSFFSAKFTRSIEEMLVTPMQPLSIISGFIIGGMIRGLAVGCLVALVTLLFTHLHVQHLGLTLITIISASLLFSLGGLLNGLFANSFDDISIIPTFIITPLTYLGGVFYSIDRLPNLWHKVSLLNPILYIVNLFRYGLLGYTDVSVTMAMGILWGCILLVLATCWWCLKTGKGLRH
jgi:ABC-2 type transport system permease protein